MPLDHISHVFRAISKKTRTLKFESQQKKLHFLILLLLQFKSETRFKFCVSMLNFASDLALVVGRKVHCVRQYFSFKNNKINPLEDIP